MESDLSLKGAQRLQLSWSEVEGSSSRREDLVTPNQRSLHTATVVGNKIYVIGGWAPNINWFQINIHCLDYVSQSWKLVVVSGDTHPNVYYHTAVLARDFIYVFGGKVGRAVSSSLTRLDPVSNEWATIPNPGIEPRYGHCAEYMEAYDAMVVLFGHTRDAKELRDIYGYEVQTRVWKKLQPKGRYPTGSGPQVMRCSCSHSTSIFCYTGHYERFAGMELSVLTFNSVLERCAWNTPLIGGRVPKVLQSSSIDYVNNYLVLFGGALRMGADSNTVYVYDLVSQTCLMAESLFIDGAKAPNRKNHRSVCVKGKILVLGGFRKRLNPYYELDINSLFHRSEE